MPEHKHEWSAWDSRHIPHHIPPVRDKKGYPVMMVRRYCKCGAEQTRKAKDVLREFASQD